MTSCKKKVTLRSSLPYVHTFYVTTEKEEAEFDGGYLLEYGTTLITQHNITIHLIYYKCLYTLVHVMIIMLETENEERQGVEHRKHDFTQ